MAAGEALPLAWGDPVARGRIRVRPEDFLVVEEPNFQPTGQGEHLVIRVRKRACNSAWVARRLARMTGTRERDVGYAGRKDRWAVCEQWFSVRMAPGRTVRLEELRESEFEALEIARHKRKIRTGALRGNRFEIIVRELEAGPSELRERLEVIAAGGVPNYFGEQRFGHQESNLASAEAMFAGAFRPSREQRSLYLSAARSMLFNRVLDARIRDGNWSQAIAGDRMMLDGSRSTFACDEVDADVVERLAHWDIHPTGPLWGSGEPPTGARVGELERRVAEAHPTLKEGLENAGLRQERRALRVRANSLRWNQPEPGCLMLAFGLPRGSYATAVLREFLQTSERQRE